LVDLHHNTTIFKIITCIASEIIAIVLLCPGTCIPFVSFEGHKDKIADRIVNLATFRYVVAIFNCQCPLSVGTNALLSIYRISAPDDSGTALSRTKVHAFREMLSSTGTKEQDADAKKRMLLEDAVLLHKRKEWVLEMLPRALGAER
jgi:hypothetical protein